MIVHDLAHARSALEQGGIGLIFVGARFDESRMFDLLEYIRQDVEHQKIPIVAAIVGASTLSAISVAGLAHSVKIYGASVFINLNDFSDDDIENARLRIVVDALILPADKVSEIQRALLKKQEPE